LHIGVRDVLRLSSVEGTCRALSDLAEALISGACWICSSALRRDFGVPPNVYTAFTVLAMGKLGGGELNFSSDVDLMYLYDAQGPEWSAIAGPDYFRRLAHKITAALNEFTGEGYVYRVDLRLRPEGEAGEITCSLEYFRRYYQTRMAAWEKLALLKAWPVAGNHALGHTFLDMARPFIFNPAFDRHAQEDVLRMKRSMDRKVAASRIAGRNVKLGTGGIREIELAAQFLQARHGGSIPDLAERNTLRALRILSHRSLLTHEEAESLSAAYIFLRDVENKLQMANDAQTHSLPVDSVELAACARLLGYPDSMLFEHDFARHTAAVNEIFLRQAGGGH
jgi:glutamate-ammonia-ligase adenylyltransferase